MIWASSRLKLNTVSNRQHKTLMKPKIKMFRIPSILRTLVSQSSNIPRRHRFSNIVIISWSNTINHTRNVQHAFTLHILVSHSSHNTGIHIIPIQPTPSNTITHSPSVLPPCLLSLPPSFLRPRSSTPCARCRTRLEQILLVFDSCTKITSSPNVHDLRYP